MEKPKNPLLFSVIIPTLNEEVCLPRLLKNLNQQKEDDFEIIISDANSEDTTKKQALKFASQLTLKIVTSKKRSPAFQKNYGAGFARGKYLIFLDADVQVPKNFLKNLKKAICKTPSLVYMPNNNPDQNLPELKVFFQLINAYFEFMQSVGKPFATLGSVVVERHFFKLVGGFPEHAILNEDHEFAQKIYNWGVRAVFPNQVKTFFSLRRLRREGFWKLFTKSIKLNAYYWLNGKVDKPVVDYQFGGNLYQRKELILNPKKKKMFFDAKKIINNAKKIIFSKNGSKNH